MKFPVMLLVLVAPAAIAAPDAITTDSAWPNTIMPLAPTLGLRGGDGAASHLIPGNRVLWLFGDSWIARVDNNHYAPGAAMVNNVALVHAAPKAGEHADDATVSIAFGPQPTPGTFSAFVMPENTAQTSWCWPSDGAVTIGSATSPKLAIFYADLARRVEKPAPGDDVWNFRFTGNRIAMVDNPEAPLADWKITQHPITPRDAARFHKEAPAISWGVVAMHDPADTTAILVFGIDGSNPYDKLLMVARVPESQLTDFSAWKFHTDQPPPNDWAAGESRATPIAHGAVDEVTIHQQRFAATATAPAHVAWLLVQGEPMLGTHILFRTAVSPLGPWSDGKTIYQVSEPATDKTLITYGAKAHPELSGPDELLISYCINATDFGHMVNDVQIYRPRFVHVPLSVFDFK